VKWGGVRLESSLLAGHGDEEEMRCSPLLLYVGRFGSARQQAMEASTSGRPLLRCLQAAKQFGSSFPTAFSGQMLFK
jgi:hypothetical protein